MAAELAEHDAEILPRHGALAVHLDRSAEQRFAGSRIALPDLAIAELQQRFEMRRDKFQCALEAPHRGVRPLQCAKHHREFIVRDGGAWLSEGNFESARRRFLEAIEIDATIPEAYNGVGVTFRMRNDLAQALEWYKKPLAVDAYYNMACIYALEGKKEMALRYLQIAALNGYATAEGIDRDPDLEPVHDEPGYRALVGQRM